jgi:GGDEF domain-containing protein
MQAAALDDAREHIHTITSRDMDTIALKFPFFKEELRGCKQRADSSETSFCAGLISIDHFAELSARYDEDVVKQVLRTVVERAAAVIQDLQLGELDAKRPPLGRVGDGLYGMILPRANFKGAEVCARKLRQVVELNSIKTMAGLVNLTLTVGVIEYHPGETVDELLTSMGAALEKARLHSFEEEVQAVQAKPKPAPVKAANTSQELRLLHYKEYDAPVH